MTIEKMNELIGKKWSEVSEKDKEQLLAEAEVYSGIDDEKVDNGEGIVDLIYPLSIQGMLVTNESDRIITINDDARIYNSEGDEQINLEGRTVYEIVCLSIEVKDTKLIKQDVTYSKDDLYPEYLKSYLSEKEALQELQNYQTEIRKYSGNTGKFYLVTEYHVEENVYDEFGERDTLEGVCGSSQISQEDKELFGLIKEVQHDDKTIE